MATDKFQGHCLMESVLLGPFHYSLL